jgi:hypothetical protein
VHLTQLYHYFLFFSLVQFFVRSKILHEYGFHFIGVGQGSILYSRFPTIFVMSLTVLVHFQYSANPFLFLFPTMSPFLIFFLKECEIENKRGFT